MKTPDALRLNIGQSPRSPGSKSLLVQESHYRTEPTVTLQDTHMKHMKLSRSQEIHTLRSVSDKQMPLESYIYNSGNFFSL